MSSSPCRIVMSFGELVNENRANPRPAKTTLNAMQADDVAELRVVASGWYDEPDEGSDRPRKMRIHLLLVLHEERIQK